MHLKRISEYARNKVIIGVLAFVVALGCFIGHRYQVNKINNLKKQLELKQQLEEMI